MGFDACTVCSGNGDQDGKDCWFCEGTGWQPLCVICDTPVEAGNPWRTNALCEFHAQEAGSKIQGRI
jgi:hypothetical protein